MVYVAYGPLQNYLTGTFLYDYATGTNRIASPIKFYKNPNVLAVTLLQCLPFVYYRIAYNGLFTKKFENAIWLSVIGLMIFIVLITGSRGGFLVAVGIGFVIAYRSRYRVPALISGIVTAVVVWFLMGQEYQQRYATITEFGESDKPAQDRILGLQHGFLMMLRYPILGVGIGNFESGRWNMFGNSLWAHNLPGQLMGELGILGTIAFCVFVYQCFKNTRRVRQILNENGMRSSPLYYHAMALHSLYLFGFYVMGALTVVLLRITQKQSECR
jgi:O-antigen ligase